MVKFDVFKGGKNGITKSTTEKQIGPDEVLIKVTHSGLCGTDIHYKEADMGLGHEGVGIVEEVGEKVTLFKKGDRAGWGYEHSSCQHCKHCLTGHETYCPERAMYGFADLDQGSLASHAIWSESFLFHIPSEMSSEDAAPLMCGGATVFTALAEYNIKPTHRVGIIGIGGLGHLAIQFAAKMGCEVVVFSGTDSKKSEAMKLGATKFYAAKGAEKLEIGRPLDVLLVTSAAQPDWKLYLPIMEAGGSIHPLTVSDGNLEIPYMPLLLKGLKIQGSVVAARQMHRDMLRFAAVHGIKPVIQKFPLDLEGIKEAFGKLEGGEMRYRGVLVAQ